MLITAYDLQKAGTEFFRLNVASGERELLLNATKGAGRFKLSPDGGMIFYTDVADATASPTVTRLVRYDIQTRRETELIADKWFDQIAVTGGQAKEILRDSALGRDALEWTPDQNFFLFGKNGGAPNSPASLWRGPAGGGKPESIGLSHVRRIREPRMHPDGKRLFYTVIEPNATEIWALENFISAKGGK